MQRYLMNLKRRNSVDMEKLLDFTKDKFTEDFKLYRFQCDCLTAQDAMDVDVDCNGDGDKFVTLRMDFNSNSFFSRLKYAYQILMGHWTWREFIPREEDYGNLMDIFNPDVKYNELP